ncbi:MAG TPA: neutral zinc metallopeptidase [Gemmatimonadales bacterium]|nr:neutral zinc metallopeptidase [Gemmatimonadales bacterium]
MRWSPGHRSPNVEDRRGSGGRFVRGAGGMGLGTVVILLVLSLIFKRDMFQLAGGGGGAAAPGAPAGAPVEATPEEQRLVELVSFVLDDAQAVWDSVLPAHGARYRPARLVLFRDAIQSACGFAESATGPFYCPADEKVYIDLGFYQELQERFGAPGDFAQAYVLAHEIGHHVQNVLGTEAQVRRARSSRPDVANELSVRLELQADCYAGVWAHSTAQRQLLERGDVEEGLGAAAAVGDDRIQRMGGGRVQPEAFTHGSSEQRMRWFRQGMDSGRPETCDTFGE